MVRFVSTILFPWVHKSLKQVLADESFVSRIFICTLLFLAVSNRKGQPIGIKAKGSILAAALKKARLREELPSRMSTHSLADAPESLIVYVWLNDCIGLEESAEIVTTEKDPTCGQTKFLAVIRERITFV